MHGVLQAELDDDAISDGGEDFLTDEQHSMLFTVSQRFDLHPPYRSDGQWA
jgi:hypothetical protein